MSERLIYGKNDMKYIVSIEVDGETASIFREKNGEIRREVIPHKFWLLSNKKHDMHWTKLEGNQYYQYGKQFKYYGSVKKEKDNYPNGDFYSISNAVEAMMVKDGYTYYKGMNVEDVSILSFDIETNGVTQNNDSRVLLIANTLRKNGKITRKLFSYDQYTDDGEMIADWCNWVREVDPSIICGHNIYYFDLPYLSYVANLYDYELTLGRDDSAIKYSKYESKFRVDGSRDLHYFKANIYGREIVDTMFLAYKYDIGRKYESYGLKPIIKQEGLEKEGRVFYDAGTIKDNYKNPEEWEKIKAYAQDDGDDALALFDLMAPVIFYLCQVVPKPMQLMVESASGSQINSVMVRSYLQERHSVAKASEVEDFQGAISFAIPGIYSNMLKIDFSALYPSIMIQYELYNKLKDPKKNFPTIVKYFAENRQKYKQLYKETGNKNYDYLQQTAKVVANSCYGFLSAAGLNYNAPEEAAFITAKGRELLKFSIEYFTSRKTESWIEEFEERTK